MERAYQDEAVAAIVAGLAEGGRGQLHAACGSGKTRMARRAAQQLVPGPGLTVLLAPTVALVAQLLGEWEDPGGAPFSALAVCSDDTIADAALRVSDLRVPVTTDQDQVESFLAGTGRQVIAATYISAARVLGPALRAAGRVADLLICDEAHHLAGPSDRMTRRVLDDEALPARRRLAMTATPRLDELASDLHGTYSMDDRTVFGPCLYSYPASRAIAEGWLKDFQLVVVGVRDAEVRELLQDPQREFVDRLGGPNLNTLIAQAALVKARARYGLQRTIAFHGRIRASAEFAASLPGMAARLEGEASPPLYARHVSGLMDHRERRRILQHLDEPPQDGWTVISNARCLGEGVDIPTVDSILVSYAMRSRVQVVQAVGRALRPSPQTTGVATIVVPVVVPNEDGELGDLDPGAYEVVWQVVRALRAHDETLGIGLDVTRSHGPGQTQLPTRITMLMPPGQSEMITRDLTLLLVRQTTSPWWDGLAAARAYQAEHGHLDVPARYRTGDGYQLGSWIHHQRNDNRRGWLRADRIAALDDLGMIWDLHQAGWERGLAAARAYQAEHGHLRVPARFRTSDGLALGSWLDDQRRAHRNGTLSDQRRKVLDELDMVWDGRRWSSGLAAARAYRAEHGHLQVPEHTVINGIDLAHWLSRRRVMHAAGTLPDEQIRILEDLGIVWDPSDDRWTRALHALRAFRARHGHLTVPRGTEIDGVKLEVWLTNKRTEYRAGKLAADRIAALEELGIVWDPFQAGWERALAAARAYRTEHGHLRVPRGAEIDGVKLGMWLNNRRSQYRAGKLAADRIAALEDLGMVW